MPDRAVIYARVSSDPRGTGRSVAEQEAECRSAAARAGWRIVKVFTDNDRSASRYATKGRPQYDALVEYLDAGGADVLVCWEASRAQRDLTAYLTLRELCERRGVLWSYSGRTYDLRDGDDRFTTGLDALLADREVDATRKRVLRATRANAESGRPHGRLLYGYRREYAEGRGGPVLVAQVVEPEQAAVICEIAQRFVSGEASYRIAGDLNNREVPSPGDRTWDPSTIARVLRNPAYIGQRVHQGKVVGSATWPAILDEAVYYAAVARLSDPCRRTTPARPVRHLLTGIARCGVCAGPIALAKNRGYASYVCKAKFCVSRREPHVDEFVERVVVARLSRPDAADIFRADDDVDTQAAKEAATALRDRLSAFYDEAAAGGLTPAALSRIETKLLPQIKEAERRAKPAPRSPLLEQLATAPAEGWSALLMEQRREVVRTLVDVKIHRTRQGSRAFDPDMVEIRWKDQLG